MKYQISQLIEKIVIIIAVTTIVYFIGLGVYRLMQTWDENTQEIKLKCLELKGYYENTGNNCVLLNY